MTLELLDTILRTNLELSKFYIKNFSENQKMQEYVYKRIDPKTARLFGIGYSDSGTSKFLKKQKVELDVAIQTGVVHIDEQNLAHDVFTNRIMFPIVRNNSVVGFAGRTMGNTSAKYINSKTTLLYNKRENLYGFWETRKHAYQAGSLVVVEGYFDMLTLFSKGIKNVVALGGTALTRQHAQIIKRYCKQAYVVLDGDKSGASAAQKAEEILESANLKVKVCTLPKGMDPDEYVVEYGKKAFLEFLQE